MQPLDKSLRNQLERTVKQAREIAEAAALAALGQLGVGEAAAFEHLGDDEKALRRKLRVHGRQLGDALNGGKVQSMDRLVEEVAYEHWHRMLFARFLAENDLLMYDGVAVTLEECEELAEEEEANNGWELAARLAAKMLPQIFRPDSPAFQLQFAANHQLPLEKLLAELPGDVFTASDSLGWVYQFWQSKRKDDVNASEVKIGARELPAVTQLFTEPYMVSFLLDNSLGAWWAGKKLSADDADVRRFKTEEELRKYCSIPGVPLEYLRFVEIPLNPPFSKGDLNTADQLPPLKKGGGGGFVWQPAAGTFDAWPDALSELKTLDPCCGSGHFLVAAFLMLVPMRMELEGLSAQEAVNAVLRENIHGLELDQRCVELAAFALALTAWNYPDAGGYRPLPELNVACSGLAISAKEDDWANLAGDNTDLRLSLKELYKQFKEAPALGSLINPGSSLASGRLFKHKWEEVGPLLTKALAGERDDEKSEMGVVALGVSKAAHLLSGKYQWVITNVPYRSSNDLDNVIRNFSSAEYSDGATDLATIFLLRIFDYLSSAGNSSLVIPQNWLVQPTYRSLRKHLLTMHGIRSIVRLGPGAFQEITGEVVNALLLSVDQKNRDGFMAIDCGRDTAYDEKIDILLKKDPNFKSSHKQLTNPDSVIFLGDQSGSLSFLGYSASSIQGIKTGEDDRYKRKYWELTRVSTEWEWLQSTVREVSDYGGLENILYWGESGDHLARKQGMTAWRKKGVAVSQMSSLPSTSYLSGAFDSNMTAIVVRDEKDLLPLYGFAISGELSRAVREFDQSLKPTNSSFEKIFFNKIKWRAFAEEKYPNGLPKPYTDDPTQWIFHGHPCGSVVWDEESKWTAHGPLRTDDSVLQVAVARLLGYRWPAELDADMELADEQREWVNRCETLLPYADEDGIVCIPPVRGEAAASDRLLNLLVAAYGDAWSNDTLAELLKNAAHAGKTLEIWLREKFFTQHCKLFGHRPFIWHIWDGLPDGFAALVNYHKLDHKLLETLIYTYLGDWISRQKQDIASGVDGAQEKLAAAETLKEKLELILAGEAPYDIFVRWKPLEQQPIGWNPDLNDGVRMNIRPFMSVPDVKKKDAGVLRDKPNIKWGKDRGKDVESAPWYHLFGGDRINDHHLSLAEKMVALEASRGGTQDE